MTLLHVVPEDARIAIPAEMLEILFQESSTVIYAKIIDAYYVAHMKIARCVVPKVRQKHPSITYVLLSA